MKNATIPNIPFRPPGPAGVTLTEVLMSLMIMSIGISSVMVLFPISVLRSVQSTQLTNAAILKYNTEAQLRQNPRLVFDPNGNYDLQTTDVARDKALAEHFLSGNNRNYMVDPVGFHELFGTDATGDGVVDAADDSVARCFGNDGQLPGFLPAGASNRSLLRRFDGGVLARFLGVEESTVDSAILSQKPEPEFNDIISSLNLLASRLARLRDGRTIQLDTTALTAISADINGATRVIGVQLPDTVLPDDLVAIPTAATTRPGNLIPDPEIAEITLFSANGKFSQTLPLTAIDPDTRRVFWSEHYYDKDQKKLVFVDLNDNGYDDVRELPLEFQGQVGQVVLRTVRSADFSWLLTVRRGSDGQARGVDVVIRYHSGVKPSDERIFPASFVSGAGFIGVNDAVDVSQSPPTITEPVLKRGAWVLDPVNARWYRITNYETRPSPGLIPSSEAAFWAAYRYRVTLESAIVSDAGAFPTATSGAVYSGAIFLPGVVDVYPMGSLSLPASL